MMALLAILMVTADMATTWYLLSMYRKRVAEGNPLARQLFKRRFIGNLIFAGLRVLTVALVIQFMYWQGMLAYFIVTGYAVANNIMVLRRMK